MPPIPCNHVHGRHRECGAREPDVALDSAGFIRGERQRVLSHFYLRSPENGEQARFSRNGRALK